MAAGGPADVDACAASCRAPYRRNTLFWEPPWMGIIDKNKDCEGGHEDGDQLVPQLDLMPITNTPFLRHTLNAGCPI